MKAFLLVLLFSGTFSFAVTAQNTILWKVKSPASDNTSYLLGTFHQMGNWFIDSHPQIKEALLKSDMAVFESVDSSQQLVALLNSRPDNWSYTEHLPKANADFLKTLSSDWAVPVHKLTPLELMVKLQQEYTEKHCGTVRPSDTWTHFDKYLLHLAKVRSIPVAGLENDSLQTGYINAAQTSFGWELARQPIQDWVENIKNGKKKGRYCGAAKDYLKLSFNYQFEEKCGDNVMLKGRNERWIPQIVPYLQNNNTFIAVGLLHLYGQCGLISQLRQRGYSVTPVKLK